jgi:hypothetical protein
VQWTAPANDGGAPITSYTVTAAPGGATTTVSGTTTTATVASLANGTSYTFTVKATNSVGTSAASAPSNAVTPQAAPGYATAVLADHPAGYWRLGETTGTTAADSSGNAHPGTYSGGVTRGVTGAITGDTDRAATFDGNTGMVAVADTATLRANGAFTIELSAKMATFANSWPGLLRKGASWTANGYLLWYSADGAVHFKRNSQSWDTPPGVITTTRYRYLVVTYDGTTIRWYVDGTQVSAAAATLPTNTGTDTLTLGQGDQPGNTTLDDIAIYNTALTPTRITTHYQAWSGQ